MDELEQQGTEQEQTPPEQEGQESAVQQPEGEQTTPEAQPEPQEDVETLKKRLADTQRWAHQLNEQMRERERREEAARLASLREGANPEVRSEVDRAMEAREIEQRQAQERKNQEVLKAIHEVEPDIDTLNQNPAFSRALEEEARKLIDAGKDPLNPALAAAAVVRAKHQFTTSQARAQAEAEDKARKASKMAAMNVPGSGAAAPSGKGKSPEEMAADVWNMSPEEFAKLKQRARGF